jgi:phosphoribosylanthranilate isomerase
VSGRVRIKICGITHPDDAEAAVAAGADLIGLNFVPGSPRCLDLATAEAISRRVDGRIERVFRDAAIISSVLRRIDLSVAVPRIESEEESRSTCR